MSHLVAIAQDVTNLNHLKQLHAHIIIHNSLHRHNFWAALLIRHSTRLRAPLQYTRLIFDSADQPNAVVFANMLRHYSQLGAHDGVISLFRQMRDSGIKSDGFVYSTAITSGIKSGKDAHLLHGDILKSGHFEDRYVRNSITNMYSKFGPIDYARKAFDEMSNKTVTDLNTMISGYWNWGKKEAAKKLFDEMPERNVITWTAMITGYSKIKDLDNAKSYFDRMPEKTVVSWNAMLSGYVQSGFSKEAVNLFDEMMNNGVQPDETTWVAVISSCSSLSDMRLAESLIDKKGIFVNCFVKTALLDMYAKCGSLETARKIFDEFGPHKNSVAWNAMISAYARVSDLTSARELFDKMPEKDVVSWNSMITGYAQNGESAMAVDLFKDMISTFGLIPDEVTTASVISACGHLGALELGNSIINSLVKNKTTFTVSVQNSLIFMYSKCGCIKNAKNVFEKMETRDMISYNALITGLASHGNGAEAIKLIWRMREEGIEPDRITYIAVLTACSHSGLFREGKTIFESIKDPETDHYACMVDLLGRVGRLDEAMALIETMPMEPHAGVYGSLLNACRVHKRVNIGEKAAKKLFEIEPENSGNYVLLSNIYASAGRWEDVNRVRDLMSKFGVKKTTGFSWVEYGGKMHKFIVGDRFHERSEEIYRVLGEIKEKMRNEGYVADKSCVLRDVEEEEKEEMVGTHSEKLAIAFGILVSEPGRIIRVVKNLRVCLDCHTAIKMISKLEKREIVVRDNNRFHCFQNGFCSCNDYW